MPTINQAKFLIINAIKTKVGTKLILYLIKNKLIIYLQVIDKPIFS